MDTAPSVAGAAARADPRSLAPGGIPASTSRSRGHHMMRGTLRRGAFAAAGTIAVTAMLCGPATATEHGEPTGGEPTEPSLTGAAKTYRPNGEDVRFTFDAHG